MLKPISNIVPWFLFRGVFLTAVIAIGTYPFLYGDYTNEQASLFALSVFALFILIWVWFRPGFYGIEFVQGSIYISTEKEEDNTFYISFPLSELVHYEIKSRFLGLGSTLYLFKRGDGHWLRSKGVRISPSFPKQISLLKKQLDAIIESNEQR